jgi:hypothetical protein
VLLFGIGTKALPSWDSRTRWNNLRGGPFGRFTGEIAWVRIDIGKEAFSDPAGLEEALTGRS